MAVTNFLEHVPHRGSSKPKRYEKTHLHAMKDSEPGQIYGELWPRCTVVYIDRESLLPTFSTRWVAVEPIHTLGRIPNRSKQEMR